MARNVVSSALSVLPAVIAVFGAVQDFSSAENASERKAAAVKAAVEALKGVEGGTGKDYLNDADYEDAANKLWDAFEAVKVLVAPKFQHSEPVSSVARGF